MITLVSWENIPNGKKAMKPTLLMAPCINGKKERTKMEYDITIELKSLKPDERLKIDKIFSDLVGKRISGWLATEEDNKSFYTTRINTDPKLFTDSLCKNIWNKINKYTLIYVGVKAANRTHINWLTYNLSTYMGMHRKA